MDEYKHVPLTDTELNDYGAAFGDVVRPEWATFGENLIEEVQAQRKRIAELDAALHALVDGEGPVDYGGRAEVMRCAFCHHAIYGDVPHTPDCPVTVARVLLKGSE